MISFLIVSFMTCKTLLNRQQLTKATINEVELKFFVLSAYSAVTLTILMGIINHLATEIFTVVVVIR